MSTGYDDMIRYADVSLAAHHERVQQLEAQQGERVWGGPAMRHRQLLEDSLRSQQLDIHRWAIGRPEGSVCTCGLVTGVDPMREGKWHLFYGWLGHLDRLTDRRTARFVVDGGPYNHVLWCAFCGPIDQVARAGDSDAALLPRHEVLARHLLQCPAP